MKLLLFLLLVICGLYLATAENCQGCVALDSYSFDKVITKFKAALVKFDVAFPYGDKHEAFSRVAEDTKDSKDLLVAEVGIKDFGKRENSDLAARYGVKKDDYPVVLLFLKGKTEPIKFVAEKDADFTTDNIKRFIRTKSGIYLGLPGCIEKLDRLAEEFKQSTSEKDRQGLLNKAKMFEQTLPEQQRTAAQVYVKTMERILEKGDVFIQTEQTRVENILKGKLSVDKKQSMEKKRNILQSFSYKDEL